MKRYWNSKSLSFIAIFFVMIIGLISFGNFFNSYNIWGQQTTLLIASPQGKEGGSSAIQKLGIPLSNPIKASSPNQPILSASVRANLTNMTEETFSKPTTKLTNQSIAPPPAESQTSVHNSTIVNQNNFNHFNHTFTTQRFSNNFLFHNIASDFISNDLIKNIIIANKTVMPIITSNNSTLPFDTRNEPSAANNGQLIFYAGNWYAARSVDAGNTWKFDSEPIKATDQKVLYDKNHHIFIWYQQLMRDDFGGNKVLINISPDALNWRTYVADSSKIFGPQWKHKMIDYPHLALTKKYLYLATNIINPEFNFNNFNRTFILRIPLNDLANGSDPSFDYYYSEKVFGFTPVQGATDTMYWAAHISNDRMAIYKWNDSDPSTKVVKFEKAIPAWQPNGLSYTCPTNDNNYCGNSDDRITAGWISNGTIGFMWNVDKGGQFPWPYINSAQFRTYDMNYTGRPLIWSKDFAYQYADVSPDSKGDLGLVTTFGGNKTNPSIAVAIIKPGETIPPWPINPVVFGGKPAPFTNLWGDFLSIQPYKSDDININNPAQFIATGFTEAGKGNQIHVEPRLLEIGK